MGLRVSGKALAAAIVTGLALPILMVGRSYPWQLALLVAIAFGLLAYSTVSAIQRLSHERRQRQNRFERDPEPGTTRQEDHD